MRYWLGVVSKEHVQKGVKGGFAQICHGKKAPLANMSKGDGLIYYSPKIAMDRAEPCKCFTAIGKIKDGKVYQVEMTPNFHPFRIDVEYFRCDAVPIGNLLDRLELTRQKSWGMQLRRGLLEMSKADFMAIAHAMGLECKVVDVKMG